jgi:hypothetical protein
MVTTYLRTPYKTKKAVKEAIANGERVTVYTIDPYGPKAVPDGHHTIVGPEPYDRRWYGQVTVRSGCLTSIK